jgi:predicted transcriptional regulator
MKTITLDVRSLADSLADAAKAMSTGNTSAARFSFSSPELLWGTLTPKRWELLKALAGVGPVSIREAARRAGRDVKAVHGDVQAMLGCGLLRKAQAGIEFPYEAVHVDFMLKAA